MDHFSPEYWSFIFQFFFIFLSVIFLIAATFTKIFERSFIGLHIIRGTLKHEYSVNAYRCLVFVVFVLLLPQLWTILHDYHSDFLAFYHAINIVTIISILGFTQFLAGRYEGTNTIQRIYDFIANYNIFLIGYLGSIEQENLFFILLGWFCVAISLFRIYVYRIRRTDNSMDSVQSAMWKGVKSYIYFVVTFLVACHYFVQLPADGNFVGNIGGYKIENGSSQPFLDLLVYCLSVSTTVGTAGVSPIETIPRLFNVFLTLIGPITVGLFLGEYRKFKVRDNNSPQNMNMNLRKAREIEKNT